MKKFYAGIGSRETPEKLRPIIKQITHFLYQEGYTLRSGGAPGADEMFETSLRSLTPYPMHTEQFREWRGQHMEIYVPWWLFQSSTSPLCHVSEEAIEFSLKYHPTGNRLSDAVKKLMGRNAYQVLGKDLKTKSDFIVCWTSNGADEEPALYHCGGTGQALRIGEAHGVPIFNLAKEGSFAEWYREQGFDMM